MPSKPTADQFQALVKRSGLVEAEPLSQVVATLQANVAVQPEASNIADSLVEKGLLTRWQADKLLRGMYRGFFLGKYRLLSLLGKGGMSSVYLAEHVLMRRRCAVKVLPFKRVKDSTYLARFHREAQAVASLDHRNIVRAYDVDVDRDVEKNREVHFLVMEYVNGRSLQELVVTDGPLDCALAADYIRQATCGLQHAHQSGMVHRDIKPANLLVDRKGVVKILDLGLARFFHDDDSESLTVEHDEKVLGTTDYLAPEQALDSHTVDARADIYSLGCTFYFLLSGTPPFTDKTLAQRLMSHQTRAPVSLRTMRPDVPETLETILFRMMAKVPAQRYQSAAEVQNALEFWLTKQTVEETNAVETGQPLAPPVEITPGNSSIVVEEAPSAVPVADDSSSSIPVGIAEADPSEERTPFQISTAEEISGEDTSIRAETVPEFPAVEENQPEWDDWAGPIPGSPAEPFSFEEHVEPIVTDYPPADPVWPAGEGIVSEASPDDRAASPAPAAFSLSAGRRTQRSKARTGFKPVLLLAAAVVVIGGIGLALLLSGGENPAPQAGAKKQKPPAQAGAIKQGPVAPPREIVVGPGEQFTSINEAIARVQETFIPSHRGDRQVIKVQGGQTYRERLVLDNSEGEFKDVRIHLVSTGAPPALLAPGDGEDPVVKLTDLKQFRLEGFKIDAGGGESAIQLRGTLRGTTLRNLEISGFTETGILATDAAGYGVGEEVVRMEGLDFAAADPTAVGLRFQPGEKPATQIRIEGCRFLDPLATGIVFHTGARGLRVENCIFSGLESGIRFDASEYVLREFAVERNTFHQLQTALLFATPPRKYPESNEFIISGNLLVDLNGPEALIQSGFNEVELLRIFADNGLARNWTTRAQSQSRAAGVFDLIGTRGRFGIQPQFLSTDPAAEDFLMPQPEAVHRGIGASMRRQ